MSKWQKIVLGISILWVVGLLIFLGVVHSTWKTVLDVLFAGNVDSLTLWTVMLGPVVLFWSIGIITAEVMRWIEQRQTTAEEQYGEGRSEGFDPSQSFHGGQENAQGPHPHGEQREP
jgi:hypothetical protein